MPSITSVPFGKTLVTWALSRAVIVVVRVVAPCPFNCDWVFTPARFAHGPVALVTPPAALTELERVDCHCVLTSPLATALAFSATRIVTMSPTRFARRSIARFRKRESGDQSEPGDVAWIPPFALA